MSPRTPIPRQERTPQAQLSEAGMHSIVGYQLAQAAVVTTQVFEAQVGTVCGLRRGELTLLTLVQGNPDVTARQLARALSVTPPNVALWIEKLEGRGWLARERSGTDARMQHIRITARGSRLVDDTLQALRRAERHALSSLSGAEHAMLLELLHKVALARGRTEPLA